MNNPKFHLILWILFLVMGIIGGCISTSHIAQNTPISPAIENSTTPNHTATITMVSPQNLYTPVPTLPSDKLQQMASLLHTEQCKLPCYLGITPGVTSLIEAKAILINLGGSYVSNYVRTDGAIEYLYNLWVGDLRGIRRTPEPDGSMIEIIHHVSVITDNNVVQIIEVYIDATKSMDLFQEYWSRFNVKGIFLLNGQPDHLYINKTDPNVVENGRYILMTYEKQGVIVQEYGPRLETNLCARNEAKFISVQISLYNPNSILSIYSTGRVPPTDRSVWLPVTEVLGIDEAEFYKQVMGDPSVCFEIK